MKAGCRAASGRWRASCTAHRIRRGDGSVCAPSHPARTRFSMQSWLRRKDIDKLTVHEEGRRLVPTLGWPHLVALGIGAIVGTGIYTLIGVGADKAGPAVLLSFLVAGVVCACAALAYAEMSTMMPAAGSAYTYRDRKSVV